MSSSTQSGGNHSDFEFIETPRPPTPKFETIEDCGVKRTSVRVPFSTLLSLSTALVIISIVCVD